MKNELHYITDEDILTAINTVLYNNDYITKEVYLKCSKPKYITELPFDLRTNDPDLLNERLIAIEDALSSRESILKDADSRISKKIKENERLGKRVEKSIDTMEKAQDKIAEESDKIVNSVNKTDFEDKIDKWNDDSFEGDMDYFKNNLSMNFDTFRKAHNNFFEKDLTETSMEDYEQAFQDYMDSATTFKQGIEIGYEEGIFNKSDVKNSDCSANIKRIQTNIDKYKKEGEKITNDVETIENNQQDIDYVTKQSTGVSKEIDILLDEYEKTHNLYVENGGKPRSTPNPQMIVNDGAKAGDSFTFLPPNYNKYMV